MREHPVEPDKVPIDVATLLGEIERGWSPRYLCFWGHRAKPGGAVGKHVLSQWWPCDLVIDDVHYASAEHYMMAEKARLFRDDNALERILTASSPSDAKTAGREVTNFVASTWDSRCFDIVVRGNVAKFSQSEALREYLLGTGDQVLVEASPVDRVWGIGLAADDPRAQIPSRWRGQNLLGFALMRVRVLLG